MRVVAVLIAVVLMVLMAGAAVADDIGPVYPWREPWNAGFTVQAGETILLGARWGSCTEGLAWSATKSLVFDYYLDDQLLETDFVWSGPVQVPDGTFPGDASGCRNPAGSMWGVFATSPLVINTPGEYQLRVVVSYGRPFVDGGDWDGDGRPDRYTGTFEPPAITVTVTQ